MLEYFTIKKLRKHHSPATNVDSSAAPGDLTPLLAPQDEHFLAKIVDKPVNQETVIVDGEQGLQVSETSTEPPTKLAAQDAPTAMQTEAAGGSDWKDALKTKWGYLENLGSVSMTRLEELGNASRTRLEQIGKRKDKENDKGKELKEAADISEPVSSTETPVASTLTTPAESPEILREDKELTDILEHLDCAPVNGTILSPSTAIKALIKKFTQILKDLLNGVPAAYHDLISLFDSSSGFIEKTYNSLPSSFKQLIASVPDKLTPEVIKTLTITSPALANVEMLGLKEIVTTPGVVKGLLRSIIQALKLRFPLLITSQVALGLGLTVLFFGLWYCYKRGKEEREKREQKEKMGTEPEEVVGTVCGTDTSQGKENLPESVQDKEGIQKEEKQEQEKDQKKGSPSKKSWWRSSSS